MGRCAAVRMLYLGWRGGVIVWTWDLGVGKGLTLPPPTHFAVPGLWHIRPRVCRAHIRAPDAPGCITHPSALPLGPSATSPKEEM